MNFIKCNDTKFNLAEVIKKATTKLVPSKQEDVKKPVKDETLKKLEKEEKQLMKEKNQLMKEQKETAKLNQELVVKKEKVQSQIMGADKRSLIMTIRRYAESKRFKEYLSTMFDLSLEKLEQLETYEVRRLLDDVRFSITNKNVSNMVGGVVLSGLQQIEKMTSSYFLDVTGLTQICVNSPEFMDVLEELKLENQTFSNASPKHRLLFHLLNNMLLANQFGKILKERQTSTQKDTKNEVPQQPEPLKEVPKEEIKANPEPEKTKEKIMSSEFIEKYKDLLF
jgi:hypothetical protein